MNIWRRQQCFVVIDTRLSLSHTHLTGKDGKAFVKKTALEAGVWGCHLFAYFCHCVLRGSNLVTARVTFGWDRV